MNRTGSRVEQADKALAEPFQHAGALKAAKAGSARIDQLMADAAKPEEPAQPELPADRSILEVSQAAGLPALSSCSEGTCGTSETPVISGTPDHRDSILTDDEKVSCDSMFICVSRSKGGCALKLGL
ncbi:2Fe-2S iron-sulfur cluster binding domain-containing protein [Arthrobacter sp. UYEF36]|uniref:2Fe-2S iron-sulfur cluster-binding protein n=1 Tax=Arthrobacter sp. UYEF36 TaxID=1756366 RepID=UPI00339AC951